MSFIKYTLLILHSLWMVTSYAQNIVLSRQVIGSYGSSHQTNSLIVMNNVGEVAVKTVSSNTIILTQGFEQNNYAISEIPITFIPPNAFSPDSDGTNDTWILPLNDLYRNNKVIIFNRWGEIIREFSNYNNFDIVWEGSNKNNQQVATGTYFYVIEVPSKNISKSGWVQIVR